MIDYEENYYVIAAFRYGDVSKTPIWGGYLKGKENLMSALGPESNPLIKRFHNSRETSDAENESDLGLELRITRVNKESYDKANEKGLAGELCVWDKVTADEIESDDEYLYAPTGRHRVWWMIFNLPRIVYLVIESVFLGVADFIRRDMKIKK